MKAVNLQVWCELPRFCDDSDDSGQVAFLVNGQKVWPSNGKFDSYVITKGDVVTLQTPGGVLEGDVRRVTHSAEGGEAIITFWLRGYWEGHADAFLSLEESSGGMGWFQVTNTEESLDNHATVIEDSGINEPVSLEVYELAHDLARFAGNNDPADPRQKSQVMRQILAAIGK